MKLTGITLTPEQCDEVYSALRESKPGTDPGVELTVDYFPDDAMKLIRERWPEAHWATVEFQFNVSNGEKMSRAKVYVDVPEAWSASCATAEEAIWSLYKATFPGPESKLDRAGKLRALADKLECESLEETRKAMAT